MGSRKKLKSEISVWLWPIVGSDSRVERQTERYIDDRAEARMEETRKKTRDGEIESSKRTKEKIDG